MVGAKMVSYKEKLSIFFVGMLNTCTRTYADIHTYIRSYAYMHTQLRIHAYASYALHAYVDMHTFIR